MAASEANIELYVKLMAGDIITVECSLAHSLSDLKQRISQADSARDLNLNLQPSKMRLFLPPADDDDGGQGKELKSDSKTLSEFNLSAESMLFLFISDQSVCQLFISFQLCRVFSSSFHCQWQVKMRPSCHVCVVDYSF
jgi:hypothetical protein